jgi:hypothetical protein
MRQVSSYHKETRLLNGSHLLASDDAAIALNTPPDHIAIDGHHDSLSKRVDVANPETIDVYVTSDQSDIPTKVTRYKVVDYEPPAPSTVNISLPYKIISILLVGAGTLIWGTRIWCCNVSR